MGTNLPGYNPDAINWLEARVIEWQNDPAAIGLTNQQVADLTSYITAARADAIKATAIRAEAQNTTNMAKGSADAMRLFAAPLIANIKNFALNSATPESIYTAAGVSPRKTAAPSPVPAQPQKIRLTLNGDGSVDVSFEAIGPVGTTWSVSRKLASETTFTQVGFAAPSPKVFTDRTIPRGEESVMYSIEGVRGGKVGPVSGGVSLLFGAQPRATSKTSGTAKAA